MVLTIEKACPGGWAFFIAKRKGDVSLPIVSKCRLV